MGLFGLFRQKRHTSAPASSWQPINPAQPQGTVRRYLDNSFYALPKDVEEKHRLDFQHYLLRSVFHSDYLAPITSPASLLDVGCGTGIWCREMAKQFPGALIVGLDLELPERQQDDPPMLSFMRGNILNGLPFEPGSFDYVHQRLLVAAMPALSWPEAVRELARVTRRGGWVELVEVGDRFPNAGPATETFLRWWNAFAALRGINSGMVVSIGEFLRRAGLYSITQQAVSIPLSAWGGRLGKALETDVLSGFNALKEQFMDKLGLDANEIEAVLKKLPAEWKQYHTSYVAYYAYGQKG